MSDINKIIDRLIRIKDGMRPRADMDAIDAINEACSALSNMNPLGLTLATMLDAAQPYLDKAAEREAVKEAGKPMRQITCLSRAKAAKAAVAKAVDVFGFQP